MPASLLQSLHLAQHQLRLPAGSAVSGSELHMLLSSIRWLSWGSHNWAASGYEDAPVKTFFSSGGSMLGTGDPGHEGQFVAAAPCATCGQAASLPHMNCANIDCNKLFLACDQHKVRQQFRIHIPQCSQ